MTRTSALFTFIIAGAALLGAACQTGGRDPADDPGGLAQVTSEVGLAPGQSALLSGMHDGQAAGFLQSATTSADKGWLTDLQFLAGNPARDCHAAAVSAGVSIIQRLDLDGTHSFPDATTLSTYVNGFAAFAAACPQIHVWIVGNEPNVTANNSDPAAYAAPYATAYVQVRAQVHALSGHQSDLVLVSPASPGSPFCMCSMHKIIQQIVAQGGQPDGFAVHAYTQGSDLSSLVGLVTNNDLQTDTCAGVSFHRNFRIYQDWITAIQGENQGTRPVFITEAGNVFTVGPQICPNTGCYPNQNIGYFQAMYSEIRSYNASHSNKLRAVTLYRWSDFHEPQSTPFAISIRSALQSDVTAAFAANLQAPVTCDNSVPVGSTACNPSDPGGQFVCTNPGASSSQQWTRQACPSGQSCSGTHCQASGVPACGFGLFCAGNQIPGAAACTSGSSTIFCCPLGKIITNGACASPPACGSGLFCSGGPIPGAAPCLSGSTSVFCCAPGHTIVNGACS